MHPNRFIHFFKNYSEQVPKYVKGLEFRSIDSDEGCTAVHQRIRHSVIVSDRSFFSFIYLIDGAEPGEY